MFVMNEDKEKKISLHCILVFNINIVNQDPPILFSLILHTIQVIFQVINKKKKFGALARDSSTFSEDSPINGAPGLSY
jgi:hypothetical protein